MKPRTKLNITLAALIVIIILLVVGVAQRRANPGQMAADDLERTARSRLAATAEDLVRFAAQTPPGPFVAEQMSAELDSRTGGHWYFAKDEDCWSALQAGAKSNLAPPNLTLFREPNQPEPLLVRIDFESENSVTLTFVQDSIVACEFNRSA